MKEIVSTKNAPEAIGPYSQAIKANGFLFVSGQLAITPETCQMEATDAVAQTHQIMKNIKAILDEEGLTFDDVVKTTIYMIDLKEFQRVNIAYGSYFSEGNFPARSTVQVSALPKGAKIEIEAIAALKS
ncbi:MAG: RidA family protein [Armatimonadota bacterium]